MDVIDLPLEQLIPYARNPRKNATAVTTVAASLKEFGWRQPIVVDEAMVILAGHTRLEAARQLGLKTVPVHVARGLTPAQAEGLPADGQPLERERRVGRGAARARARRFAGRGLRPRAGRLRRRGAQPAAGGTRR